MTALLFVAVSWLAPENLPPVAQPGQWTFVEASPEELIRDQWAGTGDEDVMVRIAWRESRFECDAKNPRSSAAGLFQTLALHKPRAERLGLSWVEVSTECWASIALAWDLYQEQGTAPWKATR